MKVKYLNHIQQNIPVKYPKLTLELTQETLKALIAETLKALMAVSTHETL